MSAPVLRLVHLYPEALGVSGDRGNVATLVERLRRGGVESQVVEHRVGDPVPTEADVVLLGHGPLSGVRSVADDARRLRPFLDDVDAQGSPVVAVGGGLELLARGVVTTEGETVEGVGFFAATSRRGAPRRTNYFQVETTYEGDALTLFGFEDHATHLELEAGAEPFGRVVHGGGNGSDGAEGVVRGSSFGTQLKGPLLPLNPALADRVLAAALRRHGVAWAPGDAHAKLDEYAAASQRVISDNLERTFKAM